MKGLLIALALLTVSIWIAPPARADVCVHAPGSNDVGECDGCLGIKDHDPAVGDKCHGFPVKAVHDLGI